MKTRFIQLIMILAVICCFGNLDLYAQTCNAPTSVTQTITNATCRSNGVIAINTVTGNPTETPQYRLYNAADNAEFRQWQDLATFTDLPPATYTLHVRYSCDNGFSSIYKKTLTVGGSYLDPSITRIEVVKRSQCNNGILRVTAVNGDRNYRYSLVASQTETEPVVSYVRPPQASNTFTGLAPGTYYVRVYDGCNSYVTRSQVLASFTPVANVISTFSFSYTPCDKLRGRINFSALNDYVSASDVRVLTITYPDGSTSTLPPPTSASVADVYFDFTMDKLGVVDPTKSFPDNISSWPVNFTVNYTDECGNIYTKNFSFNKPTITLKITESTQANPDACGSNYVFGQFNSSTNGIGVPMPAGAEYSIDGVTWNPVTPTLYGSQSGTQSFTIPHGQTVNICVRPCGPSGPVYCRSYTSNTSTLRTQLDEINRSSCTGNSGIAFKSDVSSGTVAFPISVHLISGPSGVNIPDFTYTHANSNWAYPTQTANIPVGTYKFSLTDACGNMIEREITLTHPLAQLTASYSYPCGSTDILVTFGNVDYQNVLGPSSGMFLSAQIVKLDGTPVGNIVRNANINTYTVTLPTSSIPNGDYIIKFWRESTIECKYDLPWSKTSNIIELEDVMVNLSCPGTPTTSTITANATSGVAPYRYSLYKGTYAPENLIRSSQSSNIFNDVQGTGPFVVFAEDACGRGTQGTVSTDVSSLRVSNNAGGKMPCPGFDLILSILNIESATYQWFKDGSPIAGATTNSYSITGIGNADAGDYTVELKIGTCPVLYKGFTLDPNKCDQTLPVNLTKFALKEVKKEGQPAVNVEWETVGETKNDGFQVMRSSNLKEWTVLGEVKGKGLNGESVSTLKYSFTDLVPLSGVSYYQLKQVDFDQKYVLSRVQSIELKGDFELVMSPNPVVNKLTIRGDLSKFRSAAVYNSGGVKIASKEIGTTTDSIDLSNVPAGIYIVTITDINGVKQSRNIVKL